ncbi:MAG: helix-turn-helix transcriptional regulator [Leptolyngbyaceae cyanobacterium RU_5_1]|nr:helix-turn-helix transcriptional regulator [Leptolyngbyaceae cyanobacterium RU_5_1]
MALFLDEERIIREGSDRDPSLKPDDIDRIYYARKILLQNLGHPPSLMELARAVGMNDRKLKEGFRQVFGTTVFGCLHDYRMEQARSLLRERQLNVKQVARVVGYASPTSFHAAFCKRFGMTPGAYLKVS